MYIYIYTCVYVNIHYILRMHMSAKTQMCKYMVCIAGKLYIANMAYVCICACIHVYMCTPICVCVYIYRDRESLVIVARTPEVRRKSIPIARTATQLRSLAAKFA